MAMQPFTSKAQTEVITEYPADAVVSNYVRQGIGVRSWWDTVYPTDLGGRISRVATAADGTCYLGNAIDGVTGYLVCARTDTSFTIQLPQAVEAVVNDWTGETGVVYVKRLVADGDPVTSYVVDTESQEISFEIGENSFRLPAGVAVGIVDADDNWLGYAEYDLTYTLFNESPVVAPAGAEEFDLAFGYLGAFDYDGDPTLWRRLRACKDSEALYIKGFGTANPDGWARFKIKGDRVVLEKAQYLGMENGHLEYLCAGIDEPVWDPGYQYWQHFYSVVPSMEFGYDAETGSIWALDKNDLLTVNSSADVYADGSVFCNPSFTVQTALTSYVPQAPVFNDKDFTWVNGREPQLSFQLMPFNDKGQLIDASNLGFSIYLEGELYEFDKTTYWLTESMTEIPWGYDSPSVYMYPNGFSVIFFADKNLKDLTVKSVYTVDGKKYYSGGMSPDEGGAVGVKSLSGDRTVAFIECFDLNGKKVNGSAAGVVVRRITYKDGTVSYEKSICD